ncbi:MAG: HAD family phosphatase [Candidatus Schekmanbacteria bacterium]|nr:HAD family phosphatase [Candidatus Schekmanbacteria bacterium]
MIKVIVFDLGNVIIPFCFSELYRKLADLSKYSEDEIAQIGFDSRLIRDFENGLISPGQFYQAVCHRLNIVVGYADFVDMWNNIFTEHTKVSSLIRSLKENYRLFLLSNTNELHFNYAYKKFPVLEIFDEYILSYQTGCSKPSTEIYQEVISRAGCNPDEIVYTDDIAAYVEAARKLDLQVIHFLSEEQLERDLRQLIMG